MRFSSTILVAARLCACVWVFAGCSGFGNDPILELSSEEALREGKLLLEAEKYREARPFLIHAFEIRPNSVEGREGLLLTADALFEQGGYTNYVKAQGRYRDFLNRFPTSEHAAYAQYRVAMSMARRMERPDRDMSLSVDALDALEDVRRIYPTSEYSDLAAEEIIAVRNHLARHELIVGRFYKRYRRFGTTLAAIHRLEGIIEEYPDFPEMDTVYFDLCRIYNTAEDVENRNKAADYCNRLKQEYPESAHIKKIPKGVGSYVEVEAPAATDPADDGV
jgi:outer membrane protein assembly factor BamD